MIGKIIEILSAFIVATISTLGYGGVVLLMAIESACIPLPSEIIMPFSGYLVYDRRDATFGWWVSRAPLVVSWDRWSLIGSACTAAVL